MNWQYIIAAILVLAAVFYVGRTLKRSFSREHDCPDCDLPVKQVKKIRKY